MGVRDDSQSSAISRIPGSWSRKGSLAELFKHGHRYSGEQGGQLSVGSGRESRRDVGGPELWLERIS